MTQLHDFKHTEPSPSPPLVLAPALALLEEPPAFLLDPDVVTFFVDVPAFPLGIDPDATAAFFLAGIDGQYGRAGVQEVNVYDPSKLCFHFIAIMILFHYLIIHQDW